MERDEHTFGSPATDESRLSGTERFAAARTTPPTAEPAPAKAATPWPGSQGTPGQESALLSEHDTDAFGRRWEAVQTDFLDAPRKAVENADALVADVMQRVAEQFAQERERLEDQWGGGGDVSTEDLRLTLQRYRSFFRRLLSA